MDIPPRVFKQAKNLNKQWQHISSLLGQSLLAGNVFCAHCGARLSMTTNGKYRKRADGSVDMTHRIRFWVRVYFRAKKRTCLISETGPFLSVLLAFLVEISGIEPLTS